MPWVFPRIVDEQSFSLHAEDVMLVNDISQKMNIYYWESVDSYLTASKKIDEEPEEELTPEEEQELKDLEGENFLENLVNYLGINKRTYH